MRTRRWARVLLALIAAPSAVVACGVGSAPPGAATGPITEYTVPTPGSSPNFIAEGPDGNLWFTELAGDKIGKITTGGSITEYPLATSHPQGITAGPDGNLWFTDQGGNNIDKITTSGTITEYPLPTTSSLPLGITVGPDGNLWFTEYEGDKIGKITTSGTITEYTLAAGRTPEQIIAGPDGNLWFTEVGANAIGEITTSGTITEYPLPTASAGPTSITAGPDGNLWFTEIGADKIGKITTAGSVTEYPLPTTGAGPFGVTAGPDGNIWFTEYWGDKIGVLVLAAPVRSITVSPSTVTFDKCASGSGQSTGSTLEFPNGVCETSGTDDVTVTNGGAAGHVDVAGSAAVPADGGTPWALCGGGGPACNNGAEPGEDQFTETDASGSNTSPELTTGGAQCDTGFSASCAAAANQSATETLTFVGPTTSTDDSASFTTVWTWTAVP